MGKAQLYCIAPDLPCFRGRNAVSLETLGKPKSKSFDFRFCHLSFHSFWSTATPKKHRKKVKSFTQMVRWSKLSLFYPPLLGFLYWNSGKMGHRLVRIFQTWQVHRAVAMTIAVVLCFAVIIYVHLGVSENSVPLNPMVNDHYPY